MTIALAAWYRALNFHACRLWISARGVDELVGCLVAGAVTQERLGLSDAAGGSVARIAGHTEPSWALDWIPGELETTQAPIAICWAFPALPTKPRRSTLWRVQALEMPRLDYLHRQR